MDEAELKAVVDTGKLVFSAKLFMIGVYSLWMYDYLLTLGDEVKYAWSGRRTWAFGLFVAVRYFPLMNLIWAHVVLFHDTESICQRSKWIPNLHLMGVTVLAQIVVALRIYGITRKNKFLGGAFSVLIAGQIVVGTYLFAKVVTGSLVPLPKINLDAYKACLVPRWPPGQFAFTALATSFDAFGFLVILVTAQRSLGKANFPGIPSLLKIILRDALRYFILIFGCQLILLLFLIFAPNKIKLMPGVAGLVFISVMTTRLMLSLKKAAIGPSGSWTLSTFTEFNGVRSLNFVSDSSPDTLELDSGSHPGK